MKRNFFQVAIDSKGNEVHSSKWAIKEAEYLIASVAGATGKTVAELTSGGVVWNKNKTVKWFAR